MLRLRLVTIRGASIGMSVATGHGREGIGDDGDGRGGGGGIRCQVIMLVDETGGGCSLVEGGWGFEGEKRCTTWRQTIRRKENDVRNYSQCNKARVRLVFV